MKPSTLFPLALYITGCLALPASIQTAVPVPVSQDPSPPRPFPAGRIVEVKDPSPPRPFPKYPLEGGNPLEERDPSALSRFPTDEENVALDPSPPRPFPAGHIVEVNDPSPPRPFPTKYPLESLEERDPSALSRFPTDEENVALDPSPPRPFPAGRIVDMNRPSPPMEERDPRAPHKLVALESDPSPPRPFPKYPLEGGNPLEERDPLSRFPTDEENVALDPSPPRPFPAGRIVEVKNSSPSDIIEPRTPSPLLRTPEGSEAEANDPSPPRPFPAGHIVEVQGPASSGTIEPRSPSPLLRNAEGSEAEAADPSPPRPFPAGHPVDIEPRAEMPPPHRGHGGYFPPSNPPVPEPTAPTVEADRMQKRCSCPPNFFDCCPRDTTLTRYILPAPSTPAATASPTSERPDHPNSPLHRAAWSDAVLDLPVLTLEDLVPVPVPTVTVTSTSTATAAIDTPLVTITSTSTSTTTAAIDTPLPSPPCTITLTANDFHYPGTSTAYNATVTSTRTVECGGCSLAVTTVDTGNGPVVATSRPTVTDSGTATAYATECGRSWWDQEEGDFVTLSLH